MTIKTRNRLNISLFVFSLVFLAANIIIFIYSLYTKSFSLDLFATSSSQKAFILRYNPIIVIASLFFQIIYVCVTSFMLYRVFEKTQASDISYFFLFFTKITAPTFKKKLGEKIY